MINTLTKTITQLWRDMPSYYKARWEHYEIRAQPSSTVRLFLMLLTLSRRDLVPVFDGAELRLNIRGIKHNRNAESKLNYEWYVCEEESDRQMLKGAGELLLSHANTIHTKYDAITIEQLTILGRYKLKIRLSNNINGKSDYMAISRFTVRDWDDFSMNIVWPVLLALVITFIGGLIGWFLRGG